MQQDLLGCVTKSIYFLVPLKIYSECAKTNTELDLYAAGSVQRAHSDTYVLFVTTEAAPPTQIAVWLKNSISIECTWGMRTTALCPMFFLQPFSYTSDKIPTFLVEIIIASHDHAIFDEIVSKALK